MKIQKWGNSQGVRLEKRILEIVGLKVGDEVDIIVDKQEIRIVKLCYTKYSLEELMAKMPKNYKGIDEVFGKPLGKEAW